MNTTKTIALDRFKGAVGFTLLLRRWGNARQGNLDTISTSEDKKQDILTKQRIKLTKRLIKSDEFEAICAFQGSLRTWIYKRTTPSFFREGFQLVKLEGVEMIEARLAQAQEQLQELVSTLCLVYEGQVEESKLALGELFNEADYPRVEELPNYFSVGWNWIAFTVPEGLPAELRAKEQDKLERQFADAGEQIMAGLRVAFSKLITHAAEQLEPATGEKRKVIRESMLGNVREFIETFNQRNLMNDLELQQLVNKANSVLANVNTQQLRDKSDIRENIQKQFGEIGQALDGMIVERRTRKFDFSDEEQTPEIVA